MRVEECDGVKERPQITQMVADVTRLRRLSDHGSYGLIG